LYDLNFFLACSSFPPHLGSIVFLTYSQSAPQPGLRERERKREREKERKKEREKERKKERQVLHTCFE
jgi:hypothetical protein